MPGRPHMHNGEWRYFDQQNAALSVAADVNFCI